MGATTSRPRASEASLADGIRPAGAVTSCGHVGTSQGVRLRFPYALIRMYEEGLGLWLSRAQAIPCHGSSLCKADAESDSWHKELKTKRFPEKNLLWSWTCARRTRRKFNKATNAGPVPRARCLDALINNAATSQAKETPSNRHVRTTTPWSSLCTLPMIPILPTRDE